MIPKIATKATGASSNQTMSVGPLEGPNDIRNFVWPAISQFLAVKNVKGINWRAIIDPHQRRTSPSGQAPQ
jgi:hypothetical protein